MTCIGSNSVVKVHISAYPSERYLYFEAVQKFLSTLHGVEVSFCLCPADDENNINLINTRCKKTQHISMCHNFEDGLKNLLHDSQQKHVTCKIQNRRYLLVTEDATNLMLTN